MAKKRAFVKYTKKGKIIPGSLIVTTTGGYPINGLYTEVPTNICCDTDTPGIITSSPKGWVRYTKKGAIVPGSLIIGKSHPNDGIWKEVTVDLCCPIPCQRPTTGLSSFTLSDGILYDPIGDPTNIYNFTTTLLDGCTALTDYNSGSGYALNPLIIESTILNIGERIYAIGEIDCTSITSGYYIYETDNIIIHVVDGIITELIDNNTLPVPDQPGLIDVINLSLCPNRTYSYTLNVMPAGATSIFWKAVNGGTIISGQGTLSVIVEWPSIATTAVVSAFGAREGSCYSPYRRNIIFLPDC